MSVDKVILRAFLSTLAAIGVLLAFMIAILCAVFPSTMMGLTYGLGMESSSIHFAERAYKNSEDVYYIAYATEVAIEQDKTEKIFDCGAKLLADEEFAQYCSGKSEGYGQFICGQVCKAEYLQGNKENALERALQSLQGGFPKNNAVVSLLIASKEQQDAETVAKIAVKLQELQVEGEDGEYLHRISLLATK